MSVCVCVRVEFWYRMFDEIGIAGKENCCVHKNWNVSIEIFTYHGVWWRTLAHTDYSIFIANTDIKYHCFSIRMHFRKVKISAICCWVKINFGVCADTGQQPFHTYTADTQIR